VDWEEAELKQQPKVLEFLSRQGATFPNFIFRDNRDAVKAWTDRNDGAYPPAVLLFKRSGERVPVPTNAKPDEIAAVVRKLLAEK
jgi:hypothetical protein